MHTNNDAVTVSVNAGLAQPDNADSFQNALDDIDAVTVSVSAGLVHKRKAVEKDSRPEVRWELAEGTRGPCPHAKVSGGARRVPPTYPEKLQAVLQNKCCDACRELDSSPDPLDPSRPRIWAYYKWTEVTRQQILVVILINDGAPILVLSSFGV